MDPLDFTRAFLPIFFVMVGVVYAAKVFAHRSRTGQTLIREGDNGSSQRVGRRIFDVFRTAILLACVARLIHPPIDSAFGTMPYLVTPTLALSGVALMMAGLTLVLYAHAYMGPFWRSGAPEASDAPLLTRGPFGWTRNPIFIGVQLGQLGLFLAWPSVFTALCLAVGVFVVQLQTRLEEERLAARFGDTFDAYRARTPRWL